jgi:hypothetical protein
MERRLLAGTGHRRPGTTPASSSPTAATTGPPRRRRRGRRTGTAAVDEGVHPARARARALGIQVLAENGPEPWRIGGEQVPLVVVAARRAAAVLRQGVNGVQSPAVGDAVHRLPAVPLVLWRGTELAAVDGGEAK